MLFRRDGSFLLLCRTRSWRASKDIRSLFERASPEDARAFVEHFEIPIAPIGRNPRR